MVVTQYEYDERFGSDLTVAQARETVKGVAHLEGSGQEGTADHALRILQTGRGLRRRLPSPWWSRDSVASRLSSSAVSARI
ncbi:hypothetical protein [Candidatus Nitrospira nitrosa]|uniref:hypothetical protein n=1 Tax=Candidatus Nitrospira nitrosa TaxID=1742972 RepID=UPI000AB4CD88|nr:hypothetical protein [Candidatus Nitrospira nitrosa]